VLACLLLRLLLLLLRLLLLPLMLTPYSSAHHPIIVFLQTRSLHFGHVARSFALSEAPSSLGSKKSAGKEDKKRKVTETPAAKKRQRENRKLLVSGISEFM
jgi:hypothetical protein